MLYLSPRLFRRSLTTAGALAIAVLLGCCGDDGPNPVPFGRVEGTVSMPDVLTAAGDPAEGAVVYLRGGDYDSTVTTDAEGSYAFDPVPARAMNISATLGSCLRTGNTFLNVPENATATIDLTLAALTESDTMSVGRAGAAYMEIDQATNRAILLYDANSRDGVPALVVLDLSTGQSNEMVFGDLTDAFDLKIISSDEIVFICQIGGDHGLRFINPTTLTQIGEDLPIPGGATNYEGRIAIDPNREYLFVTHTVQEGPAFLGQVFAVNTSEREFVDADTDPDDGNPAFDNELVGNSLGWAFNIGFDPVTNEILVGNRTDTILTAIDWTMWGQFDRTGGLVAPTDGVRLVNMVPPPPNNDDKGFRVEFWAFGGDKGVAAKNPNGVTRYTQYDSPEGTRGAYNLESGVTIASQEYAIRVIPERDSWFSVFRGPRVSGLGGNVTAIEERDFGTLQRRARYESQVIPFDMNPQPHAFAIDPVENVLYVAYAEETFIEVFCLQ